jgi:outer membrane protein assembly factor BamB
MSRLGIAVAALAATLVAGCDSPAAPAPAPAPAPTNGGPIQVPLKQPVGLAVAAGALWAVSANDGTVARIDPETGQVTASVRVGVTPLRAAADGDLLWITAFSGQLVAVNTASATVDRRVALNGEPEGVGVGFGSVWVVRQGAHDLTRLDRNGTILGATPLGAMPRLVAFGPSYVWTSDYADGTVTRVDPNGGPARTTVRLCEGAQGMVVNAGIVWVTCTKSGEVVALDEATLDVRGRIAVTGEPDAIRLVDGRLWVAATRGPTLVEISVNPSAPAVLGSWQVAENTPLQDRANVDLVVLDGRGWLSSPRANTVYGISWPPSWSEGPLVRK